MSLADELDSDSTPISGTKCSVCTWYAQLETVDRNTFDDWVRVGKPVLRLWRACRNNGLSTGECQFAKHVKDHHRVTS